ncbi:hypothetical protein J8V57_15070 [Xenorhabdus sp. PB61.4]|uniref:Uncharacterized protein n=1 Tax=Xenorhabdus stockiae TaxID=351614 RepID=A0A2D0KLP6_9GAMM|nr:MULTISPECIES: hypothetical protein [Xenorhabdus]MCC8367575.1 hypothetical protein [Xenorhabdus sp. PB61.4]PHM64364.1 hypothetical protein Xsto_03020 [Xenorhabdus stockiae]
MENIINAINRGKVRGYSESKQIEDETYLFEYAIKKNNGQYLAYIFSIDESKMDVYEDYAIEEIQNFQSVDEALRYLESKGADIQKLKGIKRVLPF